MAETKQLNFEVNQQNYGIDIMDIRAIERNENVSSVLGAPDYMKGVLNLRGELIPVYSIRRRFHLPDIPADEQSKLIVVNLPELPVALEADSVVGIITIDEDSVPQKRRPSMLETEATDFIGHVEEYKGKIIIVIDLKALISKAQRQQMLAILEDDNKPQK